MRDKRVYLKVKIKSLAEEAKIIRKEESKNKYFKLGLAEHRKGVVRSEARAALLAYGFLRGKKYHEIESSCRDKPDWKRVETLVEKYGIFYDFDEVTKSEFIKLKSEEQIRFFDWAGLKKPSKLKQFFSFS